MGARILVIDNYDSFVYNLVQYLCELGADPIVHRCDQLTMADVEAIDPDGVLISPGPGRPSDAGMSNEIIRTFRRGPIFGVCLGNQCGMELRITAAPDEHVMAPRHCMDEMDEVPVDD